jgi:hypothetical protein
MFRFISVFLAFSILIAKANAAEVPDVVLEYADAFSKAQTVKEQLPAGRTFSEEYAYWFFRGFTHPFGGVVTPVDLMSDAYTQGQAYWRDYPSERAGIFAGYGYLPIEREGVWSRGFEKSSFQAAGADAGDSWWVTSFDGTALRDIDIDPSSSRTDNTRVRIVGYLSPKGRYGHMGAYKQQVLVISGRRVDVERH